MEKLKPIPYPRECTPVERYMLMHVMTCNAYSAHDGNGKEKFAIDHDTKKFVIHVERNTAEMNNALTDIAIINSYAIEYIEGEN